ncbi:MAG TPA: hypothetical protein VGH64_13840 [Puia sp.]|jgi:hypothetical protein
MKPIKLSELNIDLLQRINAWTVLEETYDDEELSLMPSEINNSGAVSGATR